MNQETISTRVIEESFQVVYDVRRNNLTPAKAREINSAVSNIVRQQAIDFAMRRFALTLRSETANLIEDKQAKPRGAKK